MGFGSGIAKLLLFIINFAFVVCSLVIIILASLVLTKSAGAIGQLNAPLALLIVIGVIIFLISFFGCCGALRGSSCMLTIYSIILVVIIVAEIVLIAVVFAFSKEVDEELAKAFTDAVTARNKNDNNNPTLVAVYGIQQSLQCCGYLTPNQWISTAYPKSLPDSCCNINTPAGTCALGVSTAFEKGCRPVFEDFVESYSQWILGIGIVLAVVEVCGVFFGFTLAKHNK